MHTHPYLTSLSLHFLICKIRIIIISALQGWYENRMDNTFGKLFINIKELPPAKQKNSSIVQTFLWEHFNRREWWAKHSYLNTRPGMTQTWKCVNVTLCFSYLFHSIHLRRRGDVCKFLLGRTKSLVQNQVVKPHLTSQSKHITLYHWMTKRRRSLQVWRYNMMPFCKQIHGSD